MDSQKALQHVTLWRTAVWTLRAAYVALVVVIVGIAVDASGARRRCSRWESCSGS